MIKIKRFLALLASILVLMSVLVVPVMAYTVVPEQGTRYQSLWNLTAVEVTYLSGQVALFDLPSDWFSNSQEIINLTISYDDPDGDPNNLQISNITHGDIGSSYNLRYARMKFFSYNATSMRFIFDDTLIPYTALGGSDYAISPMMIENTHVTTDGRFNFGYAYLTTNEGQVVGRRYASYGNTSIDNLYGGNDGPPNIEGDPVDTGFFCLTPNNSWIHFFEGYSPFLDGSRGLSGEFMHFFNMDCTATFTSNVDGVYLYVPLIRSDLAVSFYDYIYATFPGYTVNTPDSGDSWASFAKLGAFFTTVLGGFLSFEFFPGITLGILFVSILGLLLLIAFLRWFAGG